MILFRNRLVFGVIKKILGVVLGTVYHILAFFSLRLTALLLLIGVVLYFTGTLDSNPAFKVIYELIVIASIVLAVISNVRKLLGIDKKKNTKVKRSKGAQIVQNDNPPIIPPDVNYPAGGGYQYPGFIPQPPQPQPYQSQPQPYQQQYTAPQYTAPQYSAPVPPVQPIENEKPTYYRVKQNPNYVMADYSNRYDLFKISNGKLIFIRTDYK